MYALVYVGGILFIGSASSLLHKPINRLHDKCSLKKLGIPQYFLGIGVHYQDYGVTVLT